MKTVHFFLGADLRSQHLGLIAIAKKANIDLLRLNAEEAVIFINSAKNKIKSFSYNGVVSYIKFDDPKRGIDMDALNEIPKAFDKNGTLNYTKALKASLEKRMLSRSRFKDLEVI